MTTKDLVLLPVLIEELFISERTVYKHKKNGVFVAGEHFYRVGEGTVKGKCVYSIEKCRKAILEHTKKTKKKGETYKKKLVKDLVNKELGNGR
tara:strand:- start:254 stop:532 length:279 start_codon:yes stop_codon:yes gene_type:complete